MHFSRNVSNTNSVSLLGVNAMFERKLTKIQIMLTNVLLFGAVYTFFHNFLFCEEGEKRGESQSLWKEEVLLAKSQVIVKLFAARR